MKSTPTLRFSLKRLSFVTLISFVAVAALLGIAASANKANRAAKARGEQAANTKAAVSPVVQNDKQPLAPTAAAITATLTDNVAPATKVAPGGIINYTAVITNTNLVSPADDAGSVVYSGNLNSNTTISGLVQVSPVTIADTYPQTVVGNVSVNSANIPYSVITNDYQGQNGGALTISAFDATTTAGGQIVMTTSGVDIGKFTYNPPPGFEGNDTFKYTLANTVGSTEATVTIPVSGMVWFINNTASACTTLAAGCGRLSNPFSTLAAFQALNNGTGNNPAINDNIFVFESATTYTGGVTLLGGQKLIGQDSTDSLVTITGLTPPTGSTGFPNMNTGAPATTITNGGGAGITLNATATSNTVRGMTVTNTSAAKISGNNFGTLTVGKSGSPDVTLSGTGQAMNLTTGTFAATSAFTSVAATSSTTTGMSITSVGGTVAFGSTTTSSTTNQGILVNTSSANIGFGNTSVTTAGGTGVNLTTNTGTATFGSLTITPNSGQRGLHATSNTAAITVASGTVTTTNNTAVEIQGINAGSRTPLNIQLQTVNTTGGAVAPNGIILRFTSATGAPGGFRVLGNAGACDAGTTTCTGGRITNTTGGDGATGGTGVYLDNADKVVLTRMHIDTNPNFGVRGFNGAGFTMDTCLVDGTNGGNAAFFEGSVVFDNLTGTAGGSNAALITGSTIKGGWGDNIRFVNTSGTLEATIASSTIRDTNVGTNGNDNIHIECHTTANMNVHITGSTFAATNGDHIQTITDGTSTLTIVVGGTAGNANTFSGGGGVNALGQGITISGGDVNGGTDSTEVVRFNISNNTMNGTIQGGAININEGVGNGNWQGQVSSNIIGTAAVNGSGASQSSGIRVENHSKGTLTAIVSGNTIHQWSVQGLTFSAGDTSATGLTNGPLNLTVTGNVVDTPNPPSAGDHGIQLNSGTQIGNTNIVCLDMINNNSTGHVSAGGVDYRPRQRMNTTVRLRGYGGGAFDNAAVNAYVLARPNTASGSGTSAASNNTPSGGGFVNTPGGAQCSQPTVPTIPNQANDLAYENAFNRNAALHAAAAIKPTQPSPAAATASLVAKLGPAAIHNDHASDANDVRSFHHVQFKRSQAVKASASDQQPVAPLSGEAIGPINIGTLPAGKSVTIKYAATVNGPPLARSVSHFGTVNFTNPVGSMNTDDTDLPGGLANPTVTLVDVLATWNGGSTDWNTPGNWTIPGGLSSYVPGTTNPGINDVVIPNTANQPTISAAMTNVSIYSLSLATGATLTIDPARTLTIIGTTGSDLAINGTISGGALVIDGAGPHTLSNTGTGSLSSSNTTTVAAGAFVFVSNNLQMGSLVVDSSSTFDISNRTLSLSGPSFTVTGTPVLTTGSTVVFNGTAAQQAAGIIYNNLTINNSIGAHVTGVTLTGNATVNGALTLTSSDLATGAFTLTMPAGATSGPASGATDVVGNVKRTGFASGGSALSFGNPFNTIRINSGTAPTDINVLLAKNAPATYAAAALRSYTITANGGSGINATVRLHYRQVDLANPLAPGGSVSETPTVDFNLRRSVGGGPWSPVVPTARNVGQVEDNWLENNAVTTFSEWTFANFTPTATNGVITGRIVDANGNPVEGAVIRLEGTQTRKIITDANGVYRFAEVETTGFYTVTPSRVNYEFSPSARSFSQLGDTTSAIFTASATGQTANPLDTPEYFVRQHYVDFLGREPDESGFNFWSDQILECGGDVNCTERRRENVSAAYFLSIEFQQTGGLVDGLYRASYGAPPRFASFMPDTRIVGEGVVVGRADWETRLRQNKEAFVAAFVNRPAFHAAYDGMDASTFVETLVSHTGVNFSASERNAWVSGLTNGSQTRADVLRSIAENQSFVNARFNETFVMMEYFGYLRRDADADGFAFWLNKLNQFGGNFEQAEMVKAFIVSGEFRGRFPR